MKFGSFDLFPVETGRIRLDGGAMFGVVPKSLWSRTNPPDEQNRIAMTTRSLLIRHGDRVFLVDTGVGDKSGEKFASIYAVDFSEFSLERGLAAAGVAPEEVTDVILTHAHFDHIGGCTSYVDGTPVLRFPNAVHYLQREHWEWAMKPSERDRASFLPENYMPIADAGKLALLDGPEEIHPGIRMEVVNGHTFAQQLVRVSQEGRSVLYCADLVPMHAHIPDPYIMGYDLQPLVTLREKQSLLSLAAVHGDVLLLEHDPLVEAATVRFTDRGHASATHGTLADVLQQQEQA